MSNERKILSTVLPDGRSVKVQFGCLRFAVPKVAKGFEELKSATLTGEVTESMLESLFRENGIITGTVG